MKFTKEHWRGTIMEALGIELQETSPDRVVVTMPVGPATRQPFGLLHGGASVVLAETAASIGAYSNIDWDTQDALGLEINANHLRTKSDGIVTATAVPLHKTKSIMVWEVRIADEQGELVCISRCTMAIRRKKEKQLPEDHS